MNYRLTSGLLALTAIAATGGPIETYIFAFSPSESQQLILNGTTTLDAVDTGFYFQNGSHDGPNPNYLTGNCVATCGFKGVHNSFFVFDLSNVTGPITSAVLSIGNAASGYVSPNPPDLLSIFDVTTAIAQLDATQSSRVDIFGDLQSGALFGSRFVDATTDGTQVQITLNSAALTAIARAEGQSFALGGALDIPEPSALLLSFAGLVALCARLSTRTQR